MPKFRRLVVPAHPHHVTQRGVRRQTTFFDDRDYRTYLSLACEMAVEAPIEIWAYCLMPNHVHMVVIPDFADSLAKYFGRLHKTYAQLTNRRYDWTGHLWQNRFHSVVLDEQHALTALRYVERNPVRAGLAHSPAEWPWSSARGNLGLIDDALIPDRPALRVAPNWREFVAAPEKTGELIRLRCATDTGRPSGNEAFLDKVEALSGRRLSKRRPGPRPN